MGEDFDVHVCIHDSYKYANLCAIPPADSSPYMYFDWVLGAWLATWFLSILMTTKATVSFKLNGCFLQTTSSKSFSGAHEPTQVFPSC